MKRICTLVLCAGLLLSAAGNANAVDFKARGEWLMGFGVLDSNLIHKTRDSSQIKKANLQSQFVADQRVRLYLDAVASENLSGTVGFEIGTQTWGEAKDGAALGADGTVVKVKHAYIDWAVPDAPLKVRMGIQPVALPNAAGGSQIIDADVAGITANYKVNDNVAVTALWMRPLNDNFGGVTTAQGQKNFQQNYLDNMDLFSLMVPLTFDGLEVTPWAMIGMIGKNSLKNYYTEDADGIADLGVTGTKDGNLPLTLYPYSYGYDQGTLGDFRDRMYNTSKAYGTLFFAGLPIKLSMFDPLNIEFDFNYGYSEAMGRYWAYGYEGIQKRSSTLRQGWLMKGLIEYKMDWGVPGILAWYASGDDSNPRNGSERIPSISPCGNFTSFLGDGGGWPYWDYAMSYAGTWGIGGQLRDVSFLEDLSHTLRLVYWGGTNSPSMAKYMANSYAWSDGWGSGASPYLTTNDGLLELNFINTYNIYENLAMNLQFDYVANYMDNSTWKKAGQRDTSFQKQDAWNVELSFKYSF